MVKVSRELRKSRLAEATWRVILEQGIGAVSVRAVAAEAGVAVGALRHLFPTQSGLLDFSAELMLERATARIAALGPASDDIEFAMNVIQEVLPLTEQTRREFEINIALLAETPANPELAVIRDRAHRELYDLFTRIATTLRREPEPTGPGTSRSSAASGPRRRVRIPSTPRAR